MRPFILTAVVANVSPFGNHLPSQMLPLHAATVREILLRFPVAHPRIGFETVSKFNPRTPETQGTKALLYGYFQYTFEQGKNQ